MTLGTRFTVLVFAPNPVNICRSPPHAMTHMMRSRSSADAFRREMDRLFSDFFPAPASDASDSPSWSPRADIVETDDAYHLSMDLPGVSPEAVDVQFADDTLRVSGQRDVSSEHKDGRFHRVERSYGQFFRAFRLGADVNPDGVDASFEDGVLTIEVPKSEARKPRQIQVRTASGLISGDDRIEEAAGAEEDPAMA